MIAIGEEVEEEEGEERGRTFFRARSPRREIINQEYYSLLETTMLPSGLAYDALPPAPPMGYVSTTQSPAIQPSINSPALSTSSKRKAATAEDDAASTKKRKQKGKDKVEPSDDESEDDGKGKKKRNRMALSCKECKVRDLLISFILRERELIVRSFDESSSDGK